MTFTIYGITITLILKIERVSHITAKVHNKTTAKTLANMHEFPDVKLKCRLKELLEDRGMTLIELSELTGIRLATLSELAHMKRSSINISQILVIVNVLRLADLSELIDLEMSEDTKQTFEIDRVRIHDFGLLPHQELELEEFRRNKQKGKR